MPVNNEELVEAILRPIDEALQSQGITPTYLVKKLKRELNAKETKTIKVKGEITDTLPGSYRVIAATEEETVIAANFIDWRTRQQARKDAHALRGDYPGPGGPDGEGQWTITLNFGGKKNEEES